MIISIPDLEDFQTCEKPRSALTPCEPGLYALYGKGNELLYIGQGWSIRNSIDHSPLTKPDKKMQSEKVTRIDFWQSPKGMSGTVLIGYCQILIGAYLPKWQALHIGFTSGGRKRKQDSQLPLWLENALVEGEIEESAA